MRFDYRVPGVYKEEVYVRAEPPLPTGVPGFVGFADPLPGVDMFFNEPVEFRRKADFDARYTGRADSYLADAVAGFFLNGGEHCYVVFARSADAKDAEVKRAALQEALAKLAPLANLDLIAIPDAMSMRMSNDELDINAVRVLQQEMLKHCAAHSGRMAILDALPGAATTTVKEQRAAVSRGMSEPVNGALYYPWLVINAETSLAASPQASGAGVVGRRLVPPSGHIAGIYARSDARVGVFKAPANEEIAGALDLEIAIDNTVQDELNPVGINCLRAFAGRGIRVWGARTLSHDSVWRYVNVRRLFLTLQRWIEMKMFWTTYETNTPRLWVRITRELSAYLDQLWTTGALAGQTAREAYYVKCDVETNPPELQDEGTVVTEIGLAPSMPSEFIIVRIIHHVGVEPR